MKQYKQPDTSALS